MPGIAGLITKMPRPQAEAELRRMVKTLRHESFYKTGTWIEESLGVYVGWAIHNGSFTDEIPFFNARGDISLVFSGEDYTRRCVTDLYEEDATFPSRVNGLFHGLLTDRSRGLAILFNDRYGMHRLCYYKSHDAFYFAAEAKSILAVRPELRKPDLRSLGEFVACSCVLEDRTIFKDICALPAASAWEFRGGTLSRRGTYFQPREWEEQAPLSSETYYQNLREILTRNLPLYFDGGERIGMAVTGGLDTRVILACHTPSPGSVPCYTFGGMFRESQDVRIGRRIASLCRQSHEVIPVGTEFLKRFPHYAERSVYITEGGVDVYRASDLYVSEMARSIAPVKVVGTYGSEILRQAVMFKPMAPQPELFQPELLASIEQAKQTYTEIRRAHPVTFAAFRQSPWYHHGILSLEQSQLKVRSPFLDADFVQAVFREPKPSALRNDIRLRLISENSPKLGRIRSDRGVGGSNGRLAAGACRGLREFSFKAEYAYDYGMPQWLSRIDRMLKPFRIERLFLGRHKLLHFRVWYRDLLAEYVQQILLDPVTLSRPYLHRQAVESVVRSHVRGTRNHTTAIHKLLTMEILHRLFVDPI